MSANMIAPSTPSRRTGCRVTSAQSAASRTISTSPARSRTARYSGSARPACRMNHTGWHRLAPVRPQEAVVHARNAARGAFTVRSIPRRCGPRTGRPPARPAGAGSRPGASRGGIVRTPPGPPRGPRRNRAARNPGRRRSGATRPGRPTGPPGVRGGRQQAFLEAGPQPLEPRIHGRVEQPQRGEPGGHRGRVAGQRPRLVDRAGGRHQVEQSGPAPVAPTGMPPPMILPSTEVRRDAERACAPPRATRNPVITSSKTSSVPCRAVSSRSSSRNPGTGGTTPMFAATGSTITAATRPGLRSNRARTLAGSLYRASSVCAAASAVTPALAGSDSVASPEPACARSPSAWPW